MKDNKLASYKTHKEIREAYRRELLTENEAINQLMNLKLLKPYTLAQAKAAIKIWRRFKE
uniref:Uncharacterized protein n=1 Tax=viral metagenome TaxID=1070528 RepID=A0A6M3LP24_9ZZZZ